MLKFPKKRKVYKIKKFKKKRKKFNSKFSNKKNPNQFKILRYKFKIKFFK